MEIRNIFDEKRKMRNRAEIIKGLSSRYFHGNVRAQLGRIITEKDIEIRKRKIAGYVF